MSVLGIAESRHPVFGIPTVGNAANRPTSLFSCTGLRHCGKPDVGFGHCGKPTSGFRHPYSRKCSKSTNRPLFVYRFKALRKTGCRFWALRKTGRRFWALLKTGRRFPAVDLPHSGLSVRHPYSRKCSKSTNRNVANQLTGMRQIDRLECSIPLHLPIFS